MSAAAPPPPARRRRAAATPSRQRQGTVLVLQGGGALGSYQAGAYEALADPNGSQPGAAECLSWVAGISIGAINAALIAGNPPERRVERLREFWNQVSLALPWPWRPDPQALGPLRPWWDDAMARWGAAFGVPGFFRPRPPWVWWPHSPASLYDTTPLRDTLRRLVDFDRLNDGPVRFSVGAVDVESGNFVYFDNREQRIGPEHIMASGALPPGFEAVPIDGRWYWDGGLVSNTPLAHVVDRLDPALREVTIWQVDLYPARGQRPRNQSEVAEREKDIRYSSRTRMVSDLVQARYGVHARLRALAELLTPEQRASARVQALLQGTEDPAVTLVHVIHRGRDHGTDTKDYEFSEWSMHEHWQAGHADMHASMRLLHQQPPTPAATFRVLDARPDAHQHPPGVPRRLVRSMPVL